MIIGDDPLAFYEQGEVELKNCLFRFIFESNRHHENFIKIFLSGTVTLEVERNDTVKWVKRKLPDKAGLSIMADCGLIFATKVFRDDLSLSDYNIQKQAILNFAPHPSALQKSKSKEVEAAFFKAELAGLDRANQVFLPVLVVLNMVTSMHRSSVNNI